jgi:hypothetical protein
MAESIRRSIGFKEAAAALGVLLIYSFFLYRLPTSTFWSPDEGGKYLQVAALRWNGGIDLVLPYAGERLDPQLRFYAHRPSERRNTFIYPVRQPDGQFRFHWPLWFSYLAKLPTVVLGPAGGYAVALLAGWIAAILAGLLAREIDADLGAPAILVVGFSTPIWFYSLCFWEHTSATALGLAGAYAVVRGEGRGPAWLIAAVCAVGAVMMRVEMIGFFAAMVIVGVGWGAARLWYRRPEDGGKRRPSAWLIWGLVIFAGISLIVLASVSLPGRHQNLLLSIPERLTRLTRIPPSLGGILVAPYWQGGPLFTDVGVRVGLMALVACSIAPWFRRVWVEAPLTILGLTAFALYTGLVVSSPERHRALHGIFPSAPFMILVAHGLREAFLQRTSKSLLLSAISLAYLVTGIIGFGLVHVGVGPRTALGLAWGQRYLLLIYPLLTILGLVGLRAYWRSHRPRGVRVAVVGLAIALIGIGVAVELRGLDESRRTRTVLAKWQRALEADRAILTDVWWLPAALAEFYTRKPVFVVDERAEVAEWIERAAGTGVSSFTFASLSPVHLNEFGKSRRKVLRRSARAVDGLYLTKVSFLPKRGGRVSR